MSITLTCRGNRDLHVLESRVRTLIGAPFTRAQITARALRGAAKLSEAEIKDLADDLKNFKMECSSLEVEFPTSMAVRVEGEIKSQILQTFIESVKQALDLSSIRTYYLLEWLKLLRELEKEKAEKAVNVIVKSENSEEKNISAPELVALLVEALMLNRTKEQPVIAEITQILLNWKNLK